MECSSRGKKTSSWELRYVEAHVMDTLSIPTPNMCTIFHVKFQELSKSTRRLMRLSSLIFLISCHLDILGIA